MRIGIAETTFARYPMGKVAIKTITENERHEIERYVVPGVKDLPVACKRLIEDYKCDIVIALGWVGPKRIDKTCGHEASLGIQQAMLAAKKHILEVFVHEDERKTEEELAELAEDRVRKHALNALALLKGKETLLPFAGKGLRQGHEHAGPLKARGSSK